MRSLIALLFITLSACAGASELTTIDLRHRPASELIPILQPMLNQTDAITGTGYTLFIRSNPETLSEIRQLIAQLDKAPRQLLITVEQQGSQQAASSGFGISGDSRVPSLEARLYDRRRQGSAHIGQQLRVMEGQWAFISAGTTVPYTTIQRRQYGERSSTESRVTYRNVESGFEVRPRLNGDQVILDIRPFHAVLSADRRGDVETHDITTTVSGPLGQWLEIGGTSGQTSSNERGIIYSATETDQQNQTVRLMVERIND